MKMNQITSGSIRYTWHYCMSVHSATEIPLLLLCLLCSLLQLVVEEPIVFLGIIIIRFLAMTCIVNLGIIFRAWADWKSGESHCFPKNYYYFSTSKCIVGPFLYSKTQQIWQSHQKWKKVVQREYKEMSIVSGATFAPYQRLTWNLALMWSWLCFTKKSCYA